MQELFPFQKDALQFLKNNKRACLNLDTGLGKTRVGIEYLKWCGGGAVICPAFLMGVWEDEGKKWGFREFSIWSYTQFSRQAASSVARGIASKCLILDESQNVSNWTAKCTREVLLQLAVHCDRVVFSTATPMRKHAGNLHPMLSVCEPGVWGKYRTFCDMYAGRKENRWNPKGYEYLGVSSNEMSQEVLRKGFERIAFSKRKDEVQAELPERFIQILWCGFTNNGFSDSELEEMLERNDYQLNAPYLQAGIAKVPDVCEFVDTFSDERQLVIFCWHRGVAEMYYQKLKDRDPGLLLGGDSKRGAVVDLFRSGRLRTLIATVGAAGQGLNLQKADTCIMAELPWSPVDLKQAEDRVFRIGSEHKCVNVYRFAQHGGIDAAILKRLERKADGARIITGGELYAV